MFERFSGKFSMFAYFTIFGNKKQGVNLYKNKQLNISFGCPQIQ